MTHRAAADFAPISGGWKGDDEYDSEGEEEFADVLNVEVYVDVTRLKELAKDGIAMRYRGEAWKYLLQVAKPDKSEELTTDKQLLQMYTNIDKSTSDVLNRIKGEISRYRMDMPFFRNDFVQKQMERLIVAYLNQNTSVDYDPAFVHALGPFVFVMHGAKEHEIYFCFLNFMKKLDDFPETIGTRVANFMGMLRNLHPELYRLLEDEQIPANRWAVSWLQFLLARELPMPCVLRLWDLYFAADDNVALHPYVCIAILDQIAEDLLDLEGPEVLGRLQHLRPLHMEAVLAQAYTRRDQVSALRLL